MYLIEDKGPAIVLMMVALCFLGTFPVIMNVLERRGRLLQHTYLDYSITNFLGAVVIVLTLGQIGSDTKETPNFFNQLGQDNGSSVGFALASGFLLSMGNLATQYGWPFVGVSATGVISSSLAVVVGTTLNYFLDDRLNSAEILFPGVGCFLVAATLGALLHGSNTADTEAKLRLAKKEGEKTEEMQTIAPGSEDVEKSPGAAPKHIEPIQTGKVAAGSAEFYKELNDKRAVKIGSASYLFGLVIVFFAGLCFALFSPALNLATNDQWDTLDPGVPHLVVYTAFFYFSVAGLIFGFGINVYFLYKPQLGLPKSTISAWLKDRNGRWWAFLAGVLCSFGNGLAFMGGQAAGYAAADSVQALPLVTTFWGVVLCKEYHRSSRKTYIYLVSMIIMFMAAVALLASSSGHRD